MGPLSRVELGQLQQYCVGATTRPDLAMPFGSGLRDRLQLTWSSIPYCVVFFSPPSDRRPFALGGQRCGISLIACAKRERESLESQRYRLCLPGGRGMLKDVTVTHQQQPAGHEGNNKFTQKLSEHRTSCPSSVGLSRPTRRAWPA